MVACASSGDPSRLRQAALGVALMLLMSLSPVLMQFDAPVRMQTGDGTQSTWSDGGQPWPQSGRTPGRVADVPAHSPDGGAGNGTPADAAELMSIVEPAVNWVYGSYSVSTDALATPIADLSASVTKDEAAAERCGGSSLFTILVQTDSNSDHTFLRIVEGEDADLAWWVDLGLTEYVKAAPVVVDVDGDGMQEVLVAYDASGTLYLDAWAPRLTCSVTGWTPGGHGGELLWSWSDESLMISSNQGPYSSSALGGHKPTTQPLLADLDLDGDAEIVIAAIDEVSEEPVVVALGLSESGATLLWDATLDKGSHPSDPAFAQTDDTTGYVLLTTTQHNSGAMWVWKLDSASGDSSWDGLSLTNSDGDTNSPHIRLPGPVIANLDSDSAPEMVLTIPTDFDGSGSVDGAEFIGMEIGNGDVLWDFEASNGYADAPPVVIDTDGDGQHDRVCWVTWSQETTWARHGHAGCHDVSGSSPDQVWQKSLEQSSGYPNDEIAVAPPTWMDIDGNGEQELLVAYGRSLWAFGGDDGSTFVWGGSIDLPHRTWSAPALADMDGGATLDLVLGDTVVSHALADVRPLLDQRGIEFSPSEPDPGETVTVTVLFENSGTADTDDETEAKLYANGQLIASYEAGTMEPVGPTGGGSFESFSVEWSGPLGEHVFELVLDPYSNVSQSRRDNDAQTTTLAIVAPYNATFEIPTEPIRVTPGESALATPNIRSTGRLAGTWSLAVDDSSLPEGWTWSDESGGGLSGIEIDVDAVWTPHLRIHAPADALGSDAGHLGLTLTLDDDPDNVSVSASLPIEANRTSGLSLRGPDGTAASTGYGLLGADAQAWMLLQNLGNAPENQITISWSGTAWGTDLRLYNMDGIEQPALSLAPDEVLLLTARMEVPDDANLGDSVATPLSMCVGSGEEETCQTISLTFEAAGVVTDVHQRSVPAQGLEWAVHADMPIGAMQLTWSLADAGMTVQGWSWSASGNLSIAGDTVIMTGTIGSQAFGTLTLDLPDDSPPAFHSFSDASDQSADHVLRLSLEVLQIYRASLLVISPTEQPHLVEVDEESLVMVRLENPGNGDDTYHLTYEILLDENITEDPGVGVAFSNDMVSLGAGSLTNIPVTVVLPDTTPARAPVSIEIHMTSMGDQSVSDSDVVILEASQDHRWNITASVGESNADGNTFAVAPGGTLEVSVEAKNVGNLNDDLTLTVSYEVTLAGDDASQGWDSQGDTVVDIGVNQTALMTVNATVPEYAWNGSTMQVTVTATAQGEEVGSFTFGIEVTHVPAWSASADQTYLDIHPNGSSIELTVIQQGNSPTMPYATVWVSGESGWDIVVPDELPVLSPGETAPMMLNITPPDTAQHGRAVELHVKLREGDGSGATEITLPLRVAIINDFDLSGKGPWFISDDGGHPIAELQNLGNAPTTIALQVLSLPSGWIVVGQTEVVLGVGEIRGVPLEVIPSADWDGSAQTVRILAEDADGNQREVSLNTEESSYSWASSPVIVVMMGDHALLQIHGTTSASSVVDSESGQLQWDDRGGWALPAVASVNGSLSVDSSTLDYVSHVVEPSLRSAECEILGSFEEVVAYCSIFNGTEPFSYSILLIDDRGAMLNSASGHVPANSPYGPINLSAEGWSPEPGSRTLTLRLLDERGFQVAIDEAGFQVRRSDWNIGVVELELDGEGSNQEVKVLTRRTNHQLLTDADCHLSLVAGEHSSTYQVDWSSTLAPIFRIDRPDVDDGIEIVVTIGCEFPWDSDSDPSDDEARLILSGGSMELPEFDMGTAVVAALLVIGASVAFAWMLRNYREDRELMEMAMAAAEERAAKKSIEPKAPDTPEPVAETQDEGISEDAAEPESEVEEGALDDFEDRLGRLMRED
uniref:Putative FG-GAP repeat protein n=1 Tax=uncultured marine microorganism HF4000_ANIW141L21 TaxID=455539 RepID=B3T5S8_9ZZZZ|nr:putative FG-GAP repeat protein [uncultured marine microorganism HF4000_ANIW141L21]